MTVNKIVLWLVTATLFLMSCQTKIQKPTRIELNSGWKFKDADNLAFAKPDFDDSSWDSISVKKNLGQARLSAKPEICLVSG